MSNYGPIETFPDGCMTFPNPGASCDFETHPIGTGQRLKELEDELRDRLAQTRCGCGHPACKRCRDDAETERALG